jgi:CBS-domain-containing membrane protein
MKNEIPVTGEILIPLAQYPCVQKSEPISNCVSQLLEKSSSDGRHLHFEGLLVIDSTQTLVGHISLTDILKSLFPSILTSEEPKIFAGKKQKYTDLSILLEDNFGKECRHLATVTAGQCMKTAPPTIAAGMHLLHALEIMVSNGHTFLPVSENGILTGVVRLSDLFKQLCGYCSIGSPSQSE